MKPVYQTRFGKTGNCWPAVLASMLELPIEETDHCSCQLDLTDWTWLKNTNELLEKHGLFYIETPRNESGNWVFCGAPADGALFIAACTTTRNLPHVVIVRCRHVSLEEANVSPEIQADYEKRSNGPWQLKGGAEAPAIKFELVHDPLPGADPGSIVEITHLIFLCRLDR